MPDRPLRILTVLNAFEKDGPGLLVRNILNRIDDPRLDLKVIAISRDGALKDEFDHDSVFLNGRSIKGIRTLSKKIQNLYSNRCGPDLIHTHLLWPDLLFRFLKKSFPRVKLVSTCHGLHASGEKGIRGKIYDFIEKRTRNQCDGWIAVSKFVEKEMVAAGYQARKVTAIPNGIDVENFHSSSSERKAAETRKRFSAPNGSPFLVTVGNLRPVKDQETMIKAMWTVRNHHPDFRLVIIGDGPLRIHLKKLIFKFQLQKNIIVHKPVYDGLPEILASADLFLTSSVYESFGLAVAESIRCGTPVVASDGGALPEIVQENLTGKTFPVGDFDKMALAVLDLLEDDSHRQEIVVKGADWAQQNLNISDTAQRYRDYWLSLAKR